MDRLSDARPRAEQTSWPEQTLSGLNVSQTLFDQTVSDMKTVAASAGVTSRAVPVGDR